MKPSFSVGTTLRCGTRTLKVIRKLDDDELLLKDLLTGCFTIARRILVHEGVKDGLYEVRLHMWRDDSNATPARAGSHAYFSLGRKEKVERLLAEVQRSFSVGASDEDEQRVTKPGELTKRAEERETVGNKGSFESKLLRRMRRAT